MDIGMLWFDNDKNAPLKTKLARASKYYARKYGKKPELVFIHPDTIGDNTKKKIAGMEVHPSTSMQTNHFWVGVRQSTREQLEESTNGN